MASAFALESKMHHGRVRAHTPGKYIVLILFVPVSLVAVGAGLWLSYAERRAAFAVIEYRNSIDGVRDAYYPMPEFLVDLRADADGRTAYLRLKMSILLDRAELSDSVERIDAFKPALTERLTFFLRELRPEDFDGSEQMMRVKAEMLRRVNLVLAPYEAGDVIIEEIVIQ
jgi:flagellar FliL protein